MTVNGNAYVNLGPDNGGIILNISEGGLSFQSSAHIERTETIRFWFSCRSRRIDTEVDEKDQEHTSPISRFIEVGSELAWTDDTRKRGGVRFTNLPDEARKQIRDWVGSAAFQHVNQGPAQRLLSVTRTCKTLARLIAARLEAALPKIRSGSRGTGFSGGVLTGILFSAFVVGVLTLFTHSRELGNSLVRLGEQLGGRSSAQPMSSTPPTNSQEPGLSAPALQPVSQVSKLTSVESQVVAAAIQAPGVEKPPRVTPAITKSERKNLPAVKLTAGRPLVPRIVATPTADLDASLLRAPAPETELTSRLGVHIEPLKAEGMAMGSEKYLEVGKFKQKPLADKQTTRLSQLGFPVKLIQRARFAGKSYQVLVGPYGNDAEAEAVHKDLASFGFTPRSYERGTRDFRLSRAFKVDSSRLPVGDCVISWESYMPDAIVKFDGDNGPRIIVDAKWVKRGARYDENAVVYEKNRDGSFNLLEVRFSGLAEALVLSKGSY